jgi:hypothetical protein
MAEESEEKIEGPEGKVPDSERPYPLREPAEDPRWALWVVRVWLGIAVSGLIFFVILLILGAFHD